MAEYKIFARPKVLSRTKPDL